MSPVLTLFFLFCAFLVQLFVALLCFFFVFFLLSGGVRLFWSKISG